MFGLILIFHTDLTLHGLISRLRRHLIGSRVLTDLRSSKVGTGVSNSLYSTSGASGAVDVKGSRC